VSTYLLDANVVIALVVQEHEHHERSAQWFAQEVDTAHLCPITEGALLRFLVRVGETSGVAAKILTGLHTHPKVAFCADALSYRDVDLTALRGHKQLTDAYLVALATAHDARLATFDKALAATHSERVLLLG